MALTAGEAATVMPIRGYVRRGRAFAGRDLAMNLSGGGLYGPVR
jgi:hypothetical protein